MIFVSRQLNHLLNKDLGYNKENLLYLNFGSEGMSVYEPLKTKLLQNPDIVNATGMSTLPNMGAAGFQTQDWDGNDENKKLVIQYVYIDHDFLETFEMKMVEGRAFSREFSTDITDAIIVNESIVKAMGMQNPIGKKVNMSSERQVARGKIIGVVKDYHYENANVQIKPLILKLAPEMVSYMILKINSDNQESVRKYIESCWSEFCPHKNIQMNSISAAVDKMYRGEKSSQQIMFLITIIAIIISCMGLFGLVLYTIQKRTKEIGIRKILGARNIGIMKMLSKEYALLIFIANILAAPLSYYFIKDNMSNYEYHITIDVWPFIAAFLISLLFAMITLIIRTRKAANSNPVDAIRYE